MQSNYKRLGDYIREVKIKNTDLKATLLLGINIDKFFMPSVANVVGTDMKTYRVVNKNQFACNRMHVGRDYRIPIALSKRDEPFMVSPAYDVFEIIDPSFLLPEYLMMWFSRKEFDRNAWFHTDADVRGGLPWKLFCDLKFPIPSPEKQLEIVREYNVIQNRIKLNNQLIAKLEETAQAIYKQWFVDFEFPDENGLPYNSNGGEMVESELGEIPKGWVFGALDKCVEVKYGKDYKHLSSGNIPLYGSGGIMTYVNAYLYAKLSVLIPRKGSLNNILIISEPFWSVDTMFYTVPRIDNILYYLFYHLKTMDFNSLNVGSAVPSMTTNYLNGMPINIPSPNLLEMHHMIIKKLFTVINNKRKELNYILQLKHLVLAKMTKVETEEFA
ncbi:restriction endonuclease subunit S [Pedobacter frigiditerrae]|uniref:restriction endonuclease subunit S n=1 Tax=Pedobacter frigiditerrae TaxID=2530452 RepID=UPI00292E1176|nr:restriction endonuclease subunit S [Pedobacter frigiditerrae]